MRQRRVKQRNSILELCSNYIYKGVHEEKKPQVGTGLIPSKDYLVAINPDRDDFRKLNGIPEAFPVYLEIGSGKGQFLTRMARNNPDKFYLACEGGVNINVRIMQKAREMGLSNLKVITDYITVPSEWFPENSIDGIYINFCDPWPKDRHAHRRLTYRKLLEQYRLIAKPGAFLQFKTDNDDLFGWSLEEFKAAGLETLEFSADLWNSEYEKDNVHTEYEEKFALTGKSINYIKLKLK